MHWWFSIRVFKPLSGKIHNRRTNIHQQRAVLHVLQGIVSFVKRFPELIKHIKELFVASINIKVILQTKISRYWTKKAINFSVCLVRRNWQSVWWELKIQKKWNAFALAQQIFDDLTVSFGSACQQWYSFNVVLVVHTHIRFQTLTMYAGNKNWKKFYECWLSGLFIA